MPIYEYQCQTCEARFEVLQPMGAGAQGLSCPECDATEVTKQFSTFAASTSAGSAGSAGGQDLSPPACGSGFT